MRVLALTPNIYGGSPGQRSSIELWEKVLSPAGIRLDYSPFETEELRAVVYESGHYLRKAAELARAYTRRLRTLDVDDYDAVLVYREAALVGPAVIERWIARTGKPIIYQLDDPLYVPYRSPFSGWFSYLKFFGKVGSICRLSRVVIVNSPHHAEYARRYNAQVREIPSLVDADVYRRRAASSDGDSPVCLGWTGSASTAPNLLQIAAPVREVAGRMQLQVRLIGAREHPFAGVTTTILPWRAETEVQDLLPIDVGLLPLPANEWNKRKFFLKLVQYMALGIPAVCTPLGSNPYVVEHGRTGFLADTPAEWVSSLERLAADPALRAEMAERAAQVAHDKYTLQANAERIVDAFRAALS